MTDEKKKVVAGVLLDTLRRYPYFREEDGMFHYDIYPSYDDGLSATRVRQILASPDLEYRFYEEVDRLYDDFAYGELFGIVKEALDNLYPENADEKEEMRDYLMDLLDGCVEFHIPYDHYLKQEFNVDLMVDTGDGNYDYTCNSLGYFDKRFGLYKLADESSLVWLARSQGYSKEELERALDEGDILNPKGFLESIRSEVFNETSHMNCLTFLVRMTLDDLLKLYKLMRLQEPDGEKIYDARYRPDCGTLRIGKKASPGLYDPWNGAGSLFEIELQKDIVLPIRYIRSCLPDRGTNYWSVESIYGMMGSAWKDVVSDIKGPEVAYGKSVWDYQKD